MASDRTIDQTGPQDRARRRALADHRARLAVEAGMQRCRIWFAGVAFVQSFLYAGDRPWLSTTVAVVLALVWLAIRTLLRRDPGTDALRRLGLAGTVVDGVIIAVAMGNLLGDPTDPVQVLPVILAGEAAIRWGREGGLIGGIVAGLLTASWSIAAHARADIVLPVAFVTFRFAVMVGLGVLLGAALGASRRNRRLAEIITDASSDLIATFGFDGKVLSVNPACEAILGYRPEELIGRDRRELVDPEDLGAPLDGDDWRRQSTRHTELRFVHRDGHHVWLELDLQADPDERLVCAIGRDVSERRRAEAELRRRAEHDDLTGVANRAHLLGRLHHALGDDRRVHLLFVDLDGFKAVNDAHGHRAGDTVLRQVADRIRAVGNPDDLVVRLAGDEFCVLLASPSDDDDARHRAELIGEALAVAYETAQGPVRLGASVGWAVSLPTDRPADLLERADLAMYATKRRRQTDADDTVSAAG